MVSMLRHLRLRLRREMESLSVDLYDNKKKEFDISRETDNPSNLTSLLVKDTKCKMLIKDMLVFG